MKYIVLGKDGKEYGPVDAETLAKWVEHGRVFKDSKVRNALMMKWNDAGKLEFLQDSFNQQEIREEEESSGLKGKLLSFLAGKTEKHDLPEEEDKKTAFRQKYTPRPAGVFQRIGAFLIDAVIVACFGLCLFFSLVISTGTWVTVETTAGFANIAAMSEFQGTGGDLSGGEGEVIEILDADGIQEALRSEGSPTVPKPAASRQPSPEPEVESAEPEPEPEKKAEFPPPNTLRKEFNSIFAVFVLGVLLYYGISLGIYAQTCGMWYFGLIIVKGHDAEALPARTFAYALLSLLFAPITPPMVLINPACRSLQGYLTGTRLISITAKAKN
ncbi:MAG: hypothetical protein JW808_07470 [Victivallales bacterium]|nr:hypothetical protein [Victivallales bacterium]